MMHNQPEISECADVFVSLAKNTSTTGQEIAVGTFIQFYLVIQVFVQS